MRRAAGAVKKLAKAQAPSAASALRQHNQVIPLDGFALLRLACHLPLPPAKPDILANFLERKLPAAGLGIVEKPP